MFKVLTILAALVPSEASGPLVHEVAQFVWDDSAADDWFGSSVSISGNIIVVGAPYDDDGGYTNSGSAYVFRTTNGGADWSETKEKLVAGDRAAYDHFGWSVAISGDVIVVGRNGDGDGGDYSGSAYVFATTDGGATWSETAKLVASDPAAGDFFGYSVSISGDVIVVGAYQNDNGAGSNSGSAYVFATTDGGTTWSETAKLGASDAAKDDEFGAAVSISGNAIVVGQGLNGHADAGGSGSAYTFAAKDAGPPAPVHEVAQFVGSDSVGGFGRSVSISGDVIVVGTRETIGDNVNSGSAYVFRTTDGGATWSQTDEKLVASDAAKRDEFGKSVAISGDVIVVGAPFDDHDGGINSGSAYVFATTDGGENWP